LGAAPAWGAQATLVADAHVNSALPAVNSGAISNLNVGGGYTTLLQFDLSLLPAGTTPAKVSRAVLRLYANRVTTPGLIAYAPVTGAWGEYSVTYSSLPAVGSAAGLFSVSQAGAFIAVDVTSLVQGWIGSPATNNGIALTAGTAMATFDSKENDQTAHAATLDIELVDAYLARRYRPIIANWLHESDVPGSVFLVGVGSAKLWVDHAAVSAALARRFNLLPVPAGWEARLGSSATVTHFLRRLTDRSLIFRGLLASSSADWTIAWDDVPTPQIDRVTHCVTLPRSGGAHYLHDYGRAVIEPQRQLTEALVEALSGLSRPGGLDASARRGAVLILAQQVLDQAGYHFPRRLSAAEITATAPLTWLTPARRRADAEDGFLAPALAP